ncbi:MAG TPA: EAL domain-containing protein, partial [Acidimicrobiales bacterium]
CSDLALVIDATGRVQDVAGDPRTVGEDDRAAVLGADAWQFVHPDDRAPLHEHFALVLATPGVRHVAEFRVPHADGHWKWVEGSATNLLDEPAVGGIVVILRDITRRKLAEAELYHRAHHDELTGLPNRALLLQRIRAATGAASDRPDEGQPVAVFLLDVDEFKLVNDTHGHAVGDRLLCLVAERLVHALRDQDTVARLGGDEFVVLCPGVRDAVEAQLIADRIQSAFDARFELAPGLCYHVHATIGVALGPPGTEPHRLLADADAAMYATKRRSPGGLGLYDDAMRHASARRLQIETDLRVAIREQQLQCHYQPIIDLATGLPVGVEALARWHHPERGLLLPHEWVPVAEASTLMVGVGRVLLEQACRDAAAWMADGRGVPVAVNLSPRELTDETLPDRVAELLYRTNLPPGLLSFEVNEQAVLADPHRAGETIALLRELGVRFSLDDFGTGFSSLAYLKDLPIEMVKIHPTFVRGVATDWNDRGIVQAVVQLGRMLGRTVAAEGVENDDQRAVLRTLGCHLGQGYRWAPPVPSDDVPAVLERLERVPRASRRQTLGLAWRRRTAAPGLG